LRYDRDVKLPIYAASGISEVWIEDLSEDVLMVFRDPSRKEYRSEVRRGRGDSISLLAFPKVVFSVEDLLGPAPK
jgi:Uma2 family endonuclease